MNDAARKLECDGHIGSPVDTCESSRASVSLAISFGSSMPPCSVCKPLNWVVNARRHEWARRSKMTHSGVSLPRRSDQKHCTTSCISRMFGCDGHKCTHGAVCEMSEAPKCLNASGCQDLDQRNSSDALSPTHLDRTGVYEMLVGLTSRRGPPNGLNSSRSDITLVLNPLRISLPIRLETPCCSKEDKGTSQVSTAPHCLDSSGCLVRSMGILATPGCLDAARSDVSDKSSRGCV
jgi:hypothetical protein